jgi:hypothetical protein
MRNGREKTIPEMMRDNDLHFGAMTEAIHETVREHKLLGQPIVVWRDGKVVWVPPEEIELDESKNGTNGEIGRQQD